MKNAKSILIEVKYINCNNLIVCIAIISNMIPVGVLHLINLDIHSQYDHLVPLKQNFSMKL